MKQILGDQDHADVSVVAVFRKQVARLWNRRRLTDRLENEAGLPRALSKSAGTHSLNRMSLFFGSTAGEGTAVFSL